MQLIQNLILASSTIPKQANFLTTKSKCQFSSATALGKADSCKWLQKVLKKLDDNLEDDDIEKAILFYHSQVDSKEDLCGQH